ncbi:Hypothetical predicted protein [Pelobates cultripes]|uniref:Uncharacterized protein n=1 Tax=Pelobates cultripes TaxID=61616 RepID=A0AAD1RPA9_PELCU|nr:Hypothetical predicted protein [Pelobates cultripes]
MSEQPAELKSWLFSAIVESMPKTIAVYHEQAKSVSKPHLALNISKSDESHNDADHDGAPCKRPWTHQPKNPRLSLPSMNHPILDPLEGSTLYSWTSTAQGTLMRKNIPFNNKPLVLTSTPANPS